MEKKEEILRVRNLDISFETTAGVVNAVRGVNLTVNRGETVAIVGESGSGKSVSAKAIMGILAKNGTIDRGQITFSYYRNPEERVTREILQMKKEEIRRHINGKRIAMVFQDPMTSLNPLMPVGKQIMACLNPRQKVADIIAQGLDIHHRYHSQKERTEMVADILHKVGLAPEHANRYPHQFSGGQRQRVGIARALVMNPKLIIADECISALDMSIQAQVVNLMKDIQDETGLAYLFIAHDLSMVKYISDRIGVLHLGYLLETGTTEEIFSHPVHPYTRSLISAIPNPNPVVERSRIALHYDYKTSGLDYGAGTMHQIEGTHFVRGTDADLEKWV